MHRSRKGENAPTPIPDEKEHHARWSRGLAEINRVLALPDVKERLAGLGIFPFPTPTPEAFGDYIKSEIAKYSKVVKESGVRAD